MLWFKPELHILYIDVWYKDLWVKFGVQKRATDGCQTNQNPNEIWRKIYLLGKIYDMKATVASLLDRKGISNHLVQTKNSVNTN